MHTMHTISPACRWWVEHAAYIGCSKMWQISRINVQILCTIIKRKLRAKILCIFIYNASRECFARICIAMCSSFSLCCFETICNVQNIKFVIKLLVIVCVIAPEDFCLYDICVWMCCLKLLLCHIWI